MKLSYFNGTTPSRKNFRRQGFTIVELIIYLLIFGILGLFGARLLTFALQSKTAVGRLSEVQTASQRIIEQIIDRVHASSGINASSTSGSTLTLYMASSSLNPTIISLISSSTIQLQEGTATTTLNPTTTLVTALSFTTFLNTSPSTSSVQIGITLGYNDKGTIDPNTIYSLQSEAMPLQ